MKYTEETPREDVTIQENIFTVPQPYGEGHILTKNEAAAMNQLLVENVRNNFAARIKTAKEKGTAIPTQDDLDKYISTYEFGERRGGGGSSDPVAKEAMSIARDLVKKAIIKKGLKVADYKASKISELAAAAVKSKPEILDQARAVVAQRASIGLDELSL